MKEQQNVKRSGNAVKNLTIILAIVLIAMIGFIGIYKPKQNRMENIVKGYDLARDLKGERVVTIKPKENKQTIIKDTEGNIIEEELTEEQIKEKGYTKEEIDNNEGKMTIENFAKVKEIINKRLSKMDAKDYNIRLNERTGEIVLEIAENEDTDTIVSNFGVTGKFEIVDNQTNEVLMDNNDIKEVKVLYNSTTTGTNVGLGIVFNKEGTTKLENISNTYIEDETSENTEDTNSTEDVEEQTDEKEGEETQGTENEEEKTEETKKQVIIKIDGEEIMTTAFEQTITTGILRLSVGQATDDVETINENAKRAETIVAGLNYGNLPVDYEVTNNEYIISDITNKQIKNIIIGITSITILGLLFLVVKYKSNGILASFAIIGYTALYLILIRYTNVIISLEGILGVVISLTINYIITKVILENINKGGSKKSVIKEYGTFFIKIIPIYIMVIVFCFVNLAHFASFGMTMFWGILLTAIYNFVITIPLVKMKEEED